MGIGRIWESNSLTFMFSSFRFFAVARESFFFFSFFLFLNLGVEKAWSALHLNSKR